MQDKQIALNTLNDLERNHPVLFHMLESRCQVCQNIFSSQECDMCEKFDMFKNIQEDCP